jgi:membrane-associated phospholipid phosphatase
VTSSFRRIAASLVPVDALIIAFLLILSIVIITAGVPSPALHAGNNLIASAAIVAAAMLSRQNRFLRFVHDWYPAITIFLIFKEIYIIISGLGLMDWDPLLIAADRMMFGTDPTVWLSRFSSPIATEILQIAYASYYFIMIAVAAELYRRKEREKFSFTLFAILYGFFLSYIGYLLFPGVGPRFTLHHFESLGTDLPGLWCTDTIRRFLDAGESIPTGAANAILIAQRDAFPSGHTQMTLIACTLAYRYRLSSRHVLAVAGGLLIISTVYLRYHYVVDVLGGILFYTLTIATAPKLFGWWKGLGVKRM